MTEKIKKRCDNEGMGEREVWSYRIDASVPLEEIDIKPRAWVFILGEAPVWKYCAICCKCIAAGARCINIAYGVKNEDADFHSAKFVCAHSTDYPESIPSCVLVTCLWKTLNTLHPLLLRSH